ncbi:MAG: hypothetical protein Crog4KO_36470 [Crocinitomicaceae bacterium]
MDTQFYALIKQTDGTYDLAVSDELRAEIASIIANQVVRVEDVEAFDEFQANRAPAWDYSDAVYREEAEIDAHPFWRTLADMAELSLGQCNKRIVDEVFYVYGLNDTYGLTDDHNMMLAILGRLFDASRAFQLAQVLDGLQWA